MFENKKILITGGTGTFGKIFIEKALETNVKKIYVFSRDELKQHELKVVYGENNPRLSFLIGDIRDKERLYRAFDGIDIVVHAAALKQVPSCEYNPFEAIKTNVMGAQNIVDAAIDCNVEKVLGISTDKAVSPVNLYGATKLCQEKIFISGNSYTGNKKTKFSIVRYGNVLGSRGSVYSVFKKAAKLGVKMPMTDLRMTRFFLLPNDAVSFVFSSLNKMVGGEIFISKMKSINMIDLAKCIFDTFKKHKNDVVSYDTIGIRYGEKLHEVLISSDESSNVIEFENEFVVMPNFKWISYCPKYKDEYLKVPENFCYSSDNNKDFMKDEDILKIIERIEKND